MNRSETRDANFSGDQRAIFVPSFIVKGWANPSSYAFCVPSEPTFRPAFSSTTPTWRAVRPCAFPIWPWFCHGEPLPRPFLPDRDGDGAT